MSLRQVFLVLGAALLPVIAGGAGADARTTVELDFESLDAIRGTTYCDTQRECYRMYDVEDEGFILRNTWGSHHQGRIQSAQPRQSLPPTFGISSEMVLERLDGGYFQMRLIPLSSLARHLVCTGWRAAHAGGGRPAGEVRSGGDLAAAKRRGRPPPGRGSTPRPRVQTRWSTTSR